MSALWSDLRYLAFTLTPKSVSVELENSTELSFDLQQVLMRKASFKEENCVAYPNGLKFKLHSASPSHILKYRKPVDP